MDNLNSASSFLKKSEDQNTTNLWIHQLSFFTDFQMAGNLGIFLNWQ